MKKTALILMSVCIVFTSLFTGLYAHAEVKLPEKAEITKKISASADYYVKEDSTFTEQNAGDFLVALNSGKDMSAYKDAFSSSVKANLDTNKGKLISTYTGKESAALYGAVILSLDKLGLDATAFQGYNIVSSFSAMDLSSNEDNPYLYRLALEGAELAKLDSSFIKAITNSLVNNYYTFGKGMDYYGYSCDNNCQFVIALAPYYDTYKSMIDDALSQIEACKVKEGYFYNSEYGTDANSNSTALALAAYSAVNDTEKALEAYNALCTFEAQDAGSYKYMLTDTEASEYSTKDALFALECFEKLTSDTQQTTTESTTQTTTNPTSQTTTHTHSFANNAKACSCGAVNPDYVAPQASGLKVKSRSTNAIRIEWTKSDDAEKYIVYKYNPSTDKYEQLAQVPATQTNYKVTGLASGTVYKFRVAIVANNKIGKKSDYVKGVTNPKQISIKSITAPSKKAISIKLGTTVCSGYQIQWSTTKDFSSNYKTVTVSKSTTKKTIKTARSKKKYYVRVRAYKTLGDTKYYGKWSTAKSITTK
ncbi:MAG: fibronectin type III domain-containing protein [Eubacterium sp.]